MVKMYYDINDKEQLSKIVDSGGTYTACHSECLEGSGDKYLMVYVDDFEKEKYDEVMRCRNCGAEVRQLKGESMIETYDGEGNYIQSGQVVLPKRPE